MCLFFHFNFLSIGTLERNHKFKNKKLSKKSTNLSFRSDFDVFFLPVLLLFSLDFFTRLSSKFTLAQLQTESTPHKYFHLNKFQCSQDTKINSKFNLFLFYLQLSLVLYYVSCPIPIPIPIPYQMTWLPIYNSDSNSSVAQIIYI